MFICSHHLKNKNHYYSSISTSSSNEGNNDGMRCIIARWTQRTHVESNERLGCSILQDFFSLSKYRCTASLIRIAEKDRDRKKRPLHIDLKEMRTTLGFVKNATMHLQTHTYVLKTIEFLMYIGIF